MAYPMFIYYVFLVNIFIISTNATSNFMKAIDSTGKSYPDGLGVVSPGHSITLTCVHKGSTIWTRRETDAKKIENLSTNDKIIITENKLVIQNISFSDRGLYYCEKSGLVYMFYLYVYAIARHNNGTAKMKVEELDVNGLKFNYAKIDASKTVSVSCTCDTGRQPVKVDIEWKGGLYPSLKTLYTISNVTNGSAKTSTLIVLKPENNREMFGKYTCSCSAVTHGQKSANVYLKTAPVFVKYNDSVRTNEEAGVKLVCEAWGYPEITKPIEWKFENRSELPLGVNVTNSQTNPGYSELVIKSANNSHRGVYSCHVENSVGSNEVPIMVRIKGRYAALWPFIGIVIQVIILAAIIIVYECKKSHKPQESSNNNFDSRNEQETGFAIRSAEPTDIRQRLMVH